jgi:predicted GNAT family acetyltransferase
MGVAAWHMGVAAWHMGGGRLARGNGEPELRQGEVQVERDEAASRFVLLVGGRQVGMLNYVRSGGAVVLIHTEVDPAHEGQGLGTLLVTSALDELRDGGELVVPRCPFVAEFIGSHPQYAGLVAGGGS